MTSCSAPSNWRRGSTWKPRTSSCGAGCAPWRGRNSSCQQEAAMADEDVYNATYTTAMNEYGREFAQAQAQLVQAEANGDPAWAADATRTMAEIRLRIAEYDRMARQHAASMRPPTRDPRTDVDLTPVEAMKVCGLDP